MKRFVILTAVAALTWCGAGCKKPGAPTPEADVVTAPRPAGALEPRPEPEAEAPAAALTDQEIDRILADSSPPATPPPEPVERVHTVRKGDTFWSLATRYYGTGRRWRDIAAANPSLDPRRLRIGQTVRIPLN